LIYLDTSALLRLIVPEDHSDALSAYVEGRIDFVSSALLAVEARRGALRRAPRTLPRVDVFLTGVEMIAMTSAVVETASRLPDPLLRTLDAIHLATALLVQPDIDVLLSYDERLLTAATAHGLPTAAPS
jgi:predicted nucleic acid-binding protein